MTDVFLIHFFLTLFMAGVIWFAQSVHYSLPGGVGKGAFGENVKMRSRDFFKTYV